jgi:hypothetical protein
MLIRESVAGDRVDSDERDPDRVREGSRLWDQCERVGRLDLLGSSVDREDGRDESVISGAMALSPPFLLQGGLRCF